MRYMISPITSKPERTWEQADIAMLILSLPPIIRRGLNLHDSVSFMETDLVRLCCLIAAIKTQKAVSIIEGNTMIHVLV